MKEFILPALHALEDFIRAYFDKLLLTVIFAALVWIGAAAINEDVKDWAMNQASTVIGAIVMLTTGAIVNRAKNGNGNTEEKRPDPDDNIKTP